MSDDTITGGMRIGLVAPRGIGKTSVVAALLAEANEVLAGTPVSVEPSGPTRKRLNKLENDVRGHLRAGEFVPGGHQATQAVANFSLAIEAVGTDRNFRLEVMDYPGGLLDSQEGAQWKQVKQWLRESDVLILPIDAAFLMEAILPWHHGQVEQELNIAEMVKLASTQWAMQREHSGRGPGTLVLAPVKCETYFADNGGTADRAMELFRAVTQRYEPVTSAVQKEAPNTKIVYCPIDTLGCVEVVRVEFNKSRAPVSHYRVRDKSAGLSRKGAADLFVMLIDQMFETAQGDQARTAEEARGLADRARDEADKDHGVLENIWMWFTGEREALREAADTLNSDANREQQALQALVETLESIRKRPLAARTLIVSQ